MPDFNPTAAALKAQNQNTITGQSTPNSISPADVGGMIASLIDGFTPYMNLINGFDILGGTIPPVNSNGNDDDIYIEGGTNLRFYKKTSGVWVLKTSVPLGISIQDGNINLQSSVNGMVITVTAGQWGIGNVIYSKATQDQFTITTADVNLDRIDAVFAKTDGTVHYVAGTASINPDSTKPATPTNEIIVTYVYVPNSSSGELPYISDSNGGVVAINPLVLTGGSSAPNNSDGSDNDIYIRVESSGTVTFYQKQTGAWAAIQNFSVSGGGSGLPPDGTLGQSIENTGPGEGGWVNIPSLIQDELDKKANLNGGNSFVGNQIIDQNLEVGGSLIVDLLSTDTPYVLSSGVSGEIQTEAEIIIGRITNTYAIDELENVSGWSDNVKELTAGLIFEGQHYRSNDTKYFYYCDTDDVAIRIYLAEMLIEDSVTVTPPTSAYMNATYPNVPNGFRVYFSGSGMSRLVIKVSSGWIFNDMTPL